MPNPLVLFDFYQSATNETLFPVEVLPNEGPPITITVQDSGSGGGTGTGGFSGVTYNQLKEAFTANNYRVDGIYLYSPDIKQLNNVVQYQKFDASGNAEVLNISNIIDPNQTVSSLLVDLSGYDGSIVLDGNAVINTTLLPFNTLQMKFLATNIKTAGISVGNNFQDIENLTGTKFFENYGDLLQTANKADEEIIEEIPYEVLNEQKVFNDFQIKTEPKVKKVEEKKTQKPVLLENKYVPLMFLGIAALSAAAIILLTKKNKK